MFDGLFRRYKDRVLAPALRLIGGLSPNTITVLAFAFGVTAAGLAAGGWLWAALAAWLMNRLLDGLDGAAARAQGGATDLGGYLDIVLDFAVYAAVPAGVAVSGGFETGRLVALAVLLASFYVNGASWMMLSAILEKRAQGAAARAEPTTVTMPPGVAGAVVTFVFFTAFLIWPAGFPALAYALAALCAISIGQRIIWAVRNLHTPLAPALDVDARTTWPVVIVGGGAAGLAAAQALRRRGVESVVLERDDVGAVWTRHYDSLKLNTHRDASALPGLRQPRDYPCFPTGTQVRAYLADYARAQGLNVKVGLTVCRAERDDAGWRVITQGGEYRCADLVMATGIWSQPVVLNLPGAERFAGRLMHSRDYRNPAAFVGRRVLVVGCGNSGAEIAAELGEAGVPTWVAMRNGATFVDRPHSGLQMSLTSALLRHAPRSLVQRALRARRADFRDLGLPREQIAEAEIYPVVGFRLPDAVRAGRVHVVAAVTALTEHGAQLADGTQLEVDDIVLATGYRPALGPVAEWVDLADGWPVLDGFRSRRTPHLYCLGYRYSGFEGWLQSIGRYANQMADQLCADRSS